MWKYCGVIKTKKLLLNGLKKINSIKNKVKNIDVRIDKYNFDEYALVLIFNLS